MNNHVFDFVQKDFASLDLIQGLWQQLNDLHRDSSPTFSSVYATKVFEHRKQELLAKAVHGQSVLFIVYHLGNPVGYCASSIDAQHHGEIDSLFVDENFRQAKLGDRLMRLSLDWLRDHQADPINIAVYAGNEKVLPFYQKYGFYPKQIILEQPPPA